MTPIASQSEAWTKFDPWPGGGTRDDKRAWCARRFEGWGHLAFQFPEPKPWPEGRTHGYIALRSPCGLLLLGSVKEWTKHCVGSVRASFTSNTSSPVVTYGRYGDDQGLLWYATELWVGSRQRINWAKGMRAVYTWVSSRMELFTYGNPWTA